MPPPRSTVATLARVRSTVGNDDDRSSGMVAPLRNGCGDGLAGAASSTCWVPRMLLWPILAVALAGSLMPGSMLSVRVGIQSFSSIFLTVPTKTSATRTRLLVLSARVSGIWT